MNELASKTCSPRHGAALSPEDAGKLLGALRGWSLTDGAKQLRRSFAFENYWKTMAFVNAVAWIAHQQDHHPDMTVGYNTLTIVFSTHSVGGLSENDFICAAKVDALGTV
jgi:4a-hydroxytetrahydrobiopterin dehydratase